MNIADIIILTAISLALIGSLIYLLRKRKNKCTDCEKCVKIHGKID